MKSSFFLLLFSFAATGCLLPADNPWPLHRHTWTAWAPVPAVLAGTVTQARSCPGCGMAQRRTEIRLVAP